MARLVLNILQVEVREEQTPDPAHLLAGLRSGGVGEILSDSTGEMWP